MQPGTFGVELAVSMDDDWISPDDEGEMMVPAVLARSMAEAEVYCELLGDHDIPAVIGDGVCDVDDVDVGDDVVHRTGGMTHGVPVLVPEVLLDDAGEIISRRDDLDEFDLIEDVGQDDADDDGSYGFSEFDESGIDGREDGEPPLGGEESMDEDDET